MPYGTIAFIVDWPFGFGNAPGTFPKMYAGNLHDMIEKKIVYTGPFAIKYLLTRRMLRQDYAVDLVAHKNLILKCEKKNGATLCFLGPREALDFSKLATVDLSGGHYGANYTQDMSSIQVSIGPPSTRMPMTLSPVVTFVNVKEKLRNGMRCHKTPSKFAKSLTSGALILWGRSRLQEGTNTYSWLFCWTTCQTGF
ncbi:hypothetical protein Tco_1005961 [Tanacetum coccineum]|uniref:Uncharacterized protein n=1 Tax=Tanacetum coccineum TaxID=301880 RepID=A0ABQ5FGP7_9ASTR